MLMQNFGVTNKEYYGMLWYFLEWSIEWTRSFSPLNRGQTALAVINGRMVLVVGC